MDANFYLWLIPLVPLLGAAINGLTGKQRSERGVAAIAATSVAISLALSLRAFFLYSGTPVVESHMPWIYAGNFHVDFNYYFDPLAAVMTLVVTGVGLLIHIYAAGYMSGDAGFYRFFAYLNLFLFFMLTLVLAGNYLLLLVGWEGVGLCSYLLIGYYFRKPEAADAGKKAFLVTRLGDLGIVAAVLLIFKTFDSLNFTEVLPAAAQFAPEHGAWGPLTIIGLLFLLGATGKSAQVPLYIWLPDAMAGPTPVSALIHAATMVTAGVYLMARSSAIYLNAPDALTMVAVIGAVTALYAATIAVVQTDIKKVLAYSTISQIGYMVMACGVAAFSAAVFHLMTHAFFKALLFLGAGSVIHGMGGEQDINKMGGLRKFMPWTSITFLIACLAIAALPPFAGFFSKDQILWEAYSSEHGGLAFWIIGVTTAAFTSFYMFRLYFLTFHGQPRFEATAARAQGAHGNGHGGHAPHESPATMTIPLMILAVLSVAGGWIGIPALLGGGDQWNHFMAPVFTQAADVNHAAAHHKASTEYLLMAISVLISLSGISLAWWFYGRQRSRDEAAADTPGALRTLVANKYYVDEAYQFLFVRPLVTFSRDILWRAVDQWVIDGAVNGAATATRGLGSVARKLQSGNIRSYAGWVIIGALLLIGYMVGYSG
ncbi:MAG: NADH-quinone oxidoreductase subunit L [Acidobacteria bacterium]|nr:NADH-quinone oxidoreductase subunit L [Acidobacteriota bacterium]